MHRLRHLGELCSASLYDVLSRPDVLDVVITALGRQEQDIAIGASGILNAKGTRGRGNVTDFLKSLPSRVARPPVPAAAVP